MKIPSHVKELFNNEKYISLGTSDLTNTPNVVGLYWKKIIDDDTIILIDNYLNKTKSNIAENKQVCLAFWNDTSHEGYKIIGDAKYFSDGKVFENGRAFIQEARPELNPKGVVEIKVKKIFEITPGPKAGKPVS